MTPLLALGVSDGVRLGTGVFVLVGALLLGGWALSQLTKPLQRQLFYTWVENVDGLQLGTPVEVNGYAVGILEGLAPNYPLIPSPPADPPSGCQVALTDRQVRFLLTLAIDRQWALPRDTKVTVERPNLVTPVISVQLGSRDEPILLERSTLCFEINPKDPKILVERADKALKEADNALKKADKALRDLAGIAEALTKPDDGLIARAGRAFDEWGEAAKATTMAVSKAGSDIDQALDAALADFQGVTQRSNELLGTVDDQVLVLSQRAGGVVEKSRAAVAGATPPLLAMLGELAYGARLLADQLPGILANLERTSQDLSELLIDVRTRPGAAIRGRYTVKPRWGGVLR